MKIKLPEKKFFSVKDLSLRWEVSESDVQHLIDAKVLPIAEKLAAKHGKRSVFWGYRAYKINPDLPCFLPLPTDADKAMWRDVMRSDQFLCDAPFPFDNEPAHDPCWFNTTGRLAATQKRDSLIAELEPVVLLGDVLAFEAENAEGEREISSKEKATLLNIIGGLLGLMLSKSPAGIEHSVFKNQSAIIDALEAHYPAKQGIKKRTLEEKFVEAKQSLQ